MVLKTLFKLWLICAFLFNALALSTINSDEDELIQPY
jgi:hypothetical protein